MSTINKRNVLKYIFIQAAFLLFSVSTVTMAQRNGDDLAFQGFTIPNDLGIKPIAMGGAFTAASGELSSLFYNPAGLSGLRKFTVQVSVNYLGKLWRDNEEWYPGGSYVFLNDYMEHLYTPPAAFNNIWSDSLGSPGGGWNPDDFKSPVMGADPYSKAAADHEENKNGLGLNNISAALPFELSGQKFVAAASFVGNYNGLDYDWNGDHLDPHWGSSTLITAPIDSIVRSNWDVYTRNRTDGTHALYGALSWEFDNYIRIGAGFNMIFGSTDDDLTLNRIGYYRFVQGGSNWSFSYDNHFYEISGTSKFSGIRLNFGGLLTTENFNLGVDIKLPYTLTRDWSYNYLETTDTTNNTYSQSGTDKVDFPVLYAVGLEYHPTKHLTISFDYHNTHFGASQFNMSSPQEDTSKTLPVWGNSNVYSVGVNYRMFKHFSVMAGYRTRTKAFIPYGVAIRDEGFPEDSYSIGFSWEVLYGTVNAAFQYSELKYYDVYFTNRNYTLVRTTNFLLGYSFQL